MCELYNRIELLCKARGVTVTDMCTGAGVPRSNLTDLKKGRQSGLSAKNLDKIANYFNVSVSYLLGTEKENPVQLDGDETELIERVRNLTPEQKKLFQSFLKTLESMP